MGADQWGRQLPHYSPHYRPPAPETLEEKARALTRESMVKVLEDRGFQCYDSETNTTLMDAIISNVKDGDIEESALDAAREEQ